MFCFQAGAMLTQMEKYCRAILSATLACIEQPRFAAGDGFNKRELDTSFIFDTIYTSSKRTWLLGL